MDQVCLIIKFPIKYIEYKSKGGKKLSMDYSRKKT